MSAQRTISAAVLALSIGSPSGAALLFSDGFETSRLSPRVDSPAEAARFLAQATFGVTRDSIDELITLGSYRAWLERQFQAPASLQLPYVRDRYYRDSAAQNPAISRAELDANLDIRFESGARHDAWWRNVLEGEDQLRQRVALALSQIFVVSDAGLLLQASQFGMADYYDTLARHAFGNYRELLEAVTLHPVMGKYLSAIRNQRSDPARNVRPDENFARELLQLFSIGVHLLDPDGSPQLAQDGRPIASYVQRDVVELAKVFTGWNYANIGWDEWGGNGNTVLPMTAVARYHEPGDKRLLNGAVTAGSAEQDLRAALDSVALHANVGPFIARRLIQRLVSSNPSPAYVQRVAAIFNDDGSGLRGNLRAVISAILLDREARDGPALLPERFGKPREPLLRITHLWRAFKARKTPGAEYGRSPDDSYKTPADGGLYRLERSTGQAPLRAPSVFNFFLPDYSPPGPARDAGLTAPEFQLAAETTLAATVNMINSHFDFASDSEWTSLDLSAESALSDDLAALLDDLNILLLSGAMSDELRAILSDYLAHATYPGGETGRRATAQDAIMLIVNSPDYLIQQ